MIYPHTFEQKTGFTAVRERIGKLCTSDAGRRAVDEMHFMTDFHAIDASLRAVDEMLAATSADNGFSLGPVPELEEALARAKAEGAFLPASDFVQVTKAISTATAVAAFFKQPEEGDESRFPHLTEKASDLNPLVHLQREIEKIIDQFGNVRDNASPELASIRRELSKISGTANSILRRVMARGVEEGLLDNDTTPSVRDGRLVIPVSPMYKRRISGIVHDQSATGKTIFIEPAEVVEINNRQRQLQLDEQREITRILTLLSTKLRPEIPAIVSNGEILGWFDFVLAKAQFARETGGTMPQLRSDGPEMDWYHAVHPVLLLSLRAKGKEVVPLNIRLTAKDRILVISGPNAGGKSVCLKTAGIVQYMAQSGVLPTVYDNSRFGIFDSIFIDIGDDQSILDDLSTYSSHLRNMRYFLKNADSHSLILIDEFGAGTEPQMGAAMAQAILARLNEIEVWGVVTTHFQNLKVFARDTQGLVNGSMLYDRQHLKPMFSLAIGSPGSSFALEIARTAGLPGEIINAAREIAGSDYVNMDKYLLDIARDRRYWENKRMEIKKKERELDNTLNSYREDAETLRSHRREIIAEAREEAKKILESSNASVERTIREIREAQADRERTRVAREKLEQEKDELKNTLKSTQIPDGNALLRKAPKSKTPGQKTTIADAPLKVGDYVKLDGTGTPGTILEISGDNAVCSFGMLKTNVKLKRLKRSLTKPSTGIKAASFLSRATTDSLRAKQLSFKREIDVRGMRADEALQAVTYFMDDAIQFQQSPVRILHGTGTGALRQALRQYLDTLPGVRSYHDEDVRFGGAGITVVEL